MTMCYIKAKSLINHYYVNDTSIVVITTACLVGWGRRIRQLSICRGLRFLKTSVISMVQNHQMVRLWSWRFGKCGVPLHCHYFQVHSHPEWLCLSELEQSNHLLCLKPFNSVKIIGQYWIECQYSNCISIVWNHLTVYKRRNYIDSNTLNHLTVCKQVLSKQMSQLMSQTI